MNFPIRFFLPFILIIASADTVALQNSDTAIVSIQTGKASAIENSTKIVEVRAEENSDRSGDMASKTVIKNDEINRYGDSNLIDV